MPKKKIGPKRIVAFQIRRYYAKKLSPKRIFETTNFALNAVAHDALGICQHQTESHAAIRRFLLEVAPERYIKVLTAEENNLYESLAKKYGFLDQRERQIADSIINRLNLSFGQRLEMIRKAEKTTAKGLPLEYYLEELEDCYALQMEIEEAKKHMKQP